MKIRAIITGATGMVGEGVLHECLLHPNVEKVLIINRRPSNIKHEKLSELVHSDFSDFASIEHELKGYNAAFLCMGVSSVGMKEDKYNNLTYNLTMALARPLAKLNPDITICYVSGAGTDSSEKGKLMWARVKGKTENHIMQLSVKQAFAFRPAMIKPTKGLKNTYTVYKILSPLLVLFQLFFPKYVCTLKQIGLAMIHSVLKSYEKKILEVTDIKKLAE